MKKDSKNCDRRSFLKTAVTSIAGVSLMGCEAQGAPNKGSSLQVWSCGGLAEAFMPANELYEKKTGVSIAYTGAFAAALGKSLVGNAETDVFAPRVLGLSRKLKEMGKMIYFKPLCFTEYVVITPKGNPAGIEGIHDLARAGVRVVMSPSASPPGGDAVQVIYKKAGIHERVNKNAAVKGSCVQMDMEAVIEGKGDAAVVEKRLTRMERFAGQVDVIEISPQFIPPPPQTFTIGVMKSAKDRDLADHYVSFITSEEGLSCFEQAGFIPAASKRGEKMIQTLGVLDV